MKILHISDIHYSINKVHSFNQFVKEPLLKSVEHMKGEIDIILVSGDLVDKGGLGNYIENFYGFDEFSLELGSALNIPQEKIIISPGNHDVVRQLDNEYTEKGLRGEIESNHSLVNEILTI